jgi:hypothetical protein
MLEIEFHYMVYVSVLERCGGNPIVFVWYFHVYIHCVGILVRGGRHTFLTTWGKISCSTPNFHAFKFFFHFISTFFFISCLPLAMPLTMLRSSKHGRRKILAFSLLPLAPKLRVKRGGFCSQPCFQVPKYGARSLKIKLKEN